MRRNIRLILSVLILVVLDQGIKLFIDRNMMGREFDILGNILGFMPFLNIKYSWINSVGNLGINLLTHIIFTSALLIIMLLAYDFITRTYKTGLLVYIMFSFLIAGGACSLVDKVAWGGSLDYLWLKGFFIFDLKDIYLTVFEVAIVSIALFNYKGFRDIKARVIWKDFLVYLKSRLLRRI